MNWDLRLKENWGLKKKLNRRLRRYGLKLMPSLGAESHGPHYPRMTHQIWIVYAKDLKHPEEQGYVVIYPRRVYWIDDPSDWWNPDEESRIWLLPRARELNNIERAGWARER